MERNTEPEHLAFFEESIAQVWGGELQADPRLLEHLALMPAFAVTELTEAFEIGFLFNLPFIAVDLITANILLSLGDDDALARDHFFAFQAVSICRGKRLGKTHSSPCLGLRSLERVYGAS